MKQVTDDRRSVPALNCSNYRTGICTTEKSTSTADRVPVENFQTWLHCRNRSPDDMAVVSFKSEVAPILVAKCGNCHVNRNRGNFSAATFAALSNSTTIAFGLPQDSRLIEVIENGEMPKGGLKVEPNELELLKRWIQLGAKFDGDNPQQPITEFAANVPTCVGRDRPQPTKPTGKETVSFGLMSPRSCLSIVDNVTSTIILAAT